MSKAILFDLDNTLANTEVLREIRDTRAYEQLTAEVLDKVKIFRQIPSLLEEIRKSKVKAGIVTNAGRGYALPVLDHLGIAHYFDAIVTYTDVKSEGKKPSPKGIRMALDELGVEASGSVLFVGDENIDHEAAYRAGITPVMPSWASRRPVSTAPAIEMSSEQLVEYLSEPDEFELFAERSAYLGTTNYRRRGVYFLPLDDSANVVTVKEKMTSLCLGRYFSQKGAVTAWLHEKHPLSVEIQRKEEDESYQIPSYWSDLVVHVIRHAPEFLYGTSEEKFDLITVIPSKVGKERRLEGLLDGIRERLRGDEAEPECIDDIFYYLEDAQSQKTLPRSERSYEAKRALHISDSGKRRVLGKRVLVVDDVTTTGSTIARARSLLMESGVVGAIGLAIAKTVSIMEDERPCPDCGRPMKVKKNHRQGTHFWGCTGYGAASNPCSHTEPLVKKECPLCGREMRVQTVRRTGEKFWSCMGWNQTPACNHSMDMDDCEMPS